MKRTYILLATMIAASGAATLLTNCSGPSGTPDGGDGGGPGDAKPPIDHVVPDVNNGDGGMEGGVTPHGTELGGGDGIRIWGVTSDDQVVFSDTITGGPYSGGLYAVSGTGGTPTKITGPSGSYYAGTSGTVVLVFDQITTAGVGKLHTWTAGGTYNTVVANNIGANFFVASADGKHIMFTANVNSTVTVGDIIGANVDGTGQATLATGVDIGPANVSAFVNGCVPSFGFPSNSTAVVAACTTNPGDAGTPSATINANAISADGGAWAATAILPAAGISNWSSDGNGTNGTKIFTATTGTVNAETVGPVTGGAGLALDAKNVWNGDWTFMYMNRAGDHILYQSAGALLSAATGTPGGTAVQSTGVNYVRAVSPDDGWIIYTTNWDKGLPPPASFGSDLYVTKSTPGSGAATQLGTGTGNALFGLTGPDNFTTDSKYVLWIENVDTSAGIGDFYAAAVPGGAGIKVATGQWQNWSASGSKVVWQDNCPLCSATANKGLAYADIKVQDVSTAGTPTLLQAGADVQLTSGLYALFISPDKTHVIYTYSQNPTGNSATPGGNGLYSITIP